ncbi:hypothetical protein JOC36_001042 [Weissella uvarum]|nr:hypothetical protein [Weissella uvarum]MBM7617485.1 hypothetical protein [Weissella uvarum]MCM0595631.1 hypothetical protein [Weissella uvarum]
MLLQQILAVIGCVLVLIWLGLRYMKITARGINYVALTGLIILIMSLFV